MKKVGGPYQPSWYFMSELITLWHRVMNSSHIRVGDSLEKSKPNSRKGSTFPMAEYGGNETTNSLGGKKARPLG